jgi:Kef-type K+ transport system membrane component KefB
VFLGPIGTGLISDPENIDTIAQLGLIFLLFLIGLEINVRSLLASGRTVVITGLLQYPLTALVGFGIAQLLVTLGLVGDLFDGSFAALYVGLALAASSTLLVVKLFQQTFTLDTMVGRVCLALLVFQDLWAIVVIALQPNLDDPSPGPILWSFVGIGFVATLAWLVGSQIIPIGFQWIAKQPEVVLIASVAWCFIIVITGLNLGPVVDALIGTDPGVSVGAGMGALIAGITIASLPYSKEIVSQVGVVRDFFVTLFFVGLGMTIPAPDGVGVLILAVVLAVLAVVLRFVVMLPLLAWTGLDLRTATATSTKLAQISEFSLVIAFLGLSLGHVGDNLNATIIFAFVLTSLATPWLFRSSDAAVEHLLPVLTRLGFRAPADEVNEAQEDYALALLGVHRTASSFLHELVARQPELLARTLVVDFNVGIHPRIAALGATVCYGDLSRPETLLQAGVTRAQVVLCTIPNDLLSATSTTDLVATVRELHPDCVLIATATTFGEADALEAAGADLVLLPRLDSADAALDAVDAALTGQLTPLRDESAHRRQSDRHEVLD